MTDYDRNSTAQSSGFVYIIQASSGHIKIGKAKNVEARLSTLRTASPFPLTLINSIPSDDPNWLEKLLHRMFASKRVNGEWFILHIQELEYLAGLNKDSDFSLTPEDIEDDAVFDADYVEHLVDSVTPLWGEL